MLDISSYLLGAESVVGTQNIFVDLTHLHLFEVLRIDCLLFDHGTHFAVVWILHREVLVNIPIFLYSLLLQFSKIQQLLIHLLLSLFEVKFHRFGRARDHADVEKPIFKVEILVFLKSAEKSLLLFLVHVLGIGLPNRACIDFKLALKKIFGLVPPS